MAKLSHKFSSWILYILFAIILIVLALFYFVGYNNPVGEYNAPKNTELLIFLIYAMVIIAAVLFVVGKCVHLISMLKHEPKTGLLFLAFDVLLVVLFIVTWMIASDKPLALADGSIFSDATMLKVSDMMIYAIYALFGIAALGTLLNLSGIFKKIK